MDRKIEKEIDIGRTYQTIVEGWRVRVMCH